MSKVVNQLKNIQGSSLVIFTKLHNYHWNITGMQFFPVHEFTEKLYTEFSTLYDDAAERVLQLKQTPIVLISDAINASFIKEDATTTFDAQYVCTAILADLELFLKEFKTLSTLANEEEDTTTAAFADDQVAHLEKTIWMVTASLA